MFITISQNTEIFRGCNPHNNFIGHWFALDIDTARRYGTIIKRYKVKRDLKLINLLSDIFHKDFISKLTIEFPGTNSDGHDPRKMMLLVPLGLPDLHFQSLIASQIIGNTTIPPTDPAFLAFWKTINNVSRFSEYTLDREFANKIVEIYGGICDGFTLPLKCPCIPQGGLFHRELYINDISYVEYISDVTAPMPGGSRDIEQIKPLRYFKSDSDYLNFLDELRESCTNPYAQKEIKNGFVTGYFDDEHNKEKRRKTRKLRRVI
jgi:hypothetical protein